MNYEAKRVSDEVRFEAKREAERTARLHSHQQEKEACGCVRGSEWQGKKEHELVCVAFKKIRDARRAFSAEHACSRPDSAMKAIFQSFTASKERFQNE